jgi:hypothetical protein
VLPAFSQHKIEHVFIYKKDGGDLATTRSPHGVFMNVGSAKPTVIPTFAGGSGDPGTAAAPTVANHDAVAQVHLNLKDTPENGRGEHHKTTHHEQHSTSRFCTFLRQA